MTKTKKRGKVIGADVKVLDVSDGDPLDHDNFDTIYVSFGRKEFRRFSRSSEGEIIGDEYGVPDSKIWAYLRNENALKKLRKSPVVVGLGGEWNVGYKIIGYKLVRRS